MDAVVVDILGYTGDEAVGVAGLGVVCCSVLAQANNKHDETASVNGFNSVIFCVAGLLILYKNAISCPTNTNENNFAL